MKTSSRNRRTSVAGRSRGVILLVMLGLLAMFTLIAVTFVVAEVKVLVIRELPEESEALERVLAESKIGARVMNAAQAPASLTEMAGYDAIVLVNEPSVEDAIAIMKGLKPYYENFHKVKYTNDAIKAFRQRFHREAMAI